MCEISRVLQGKDLAGSQTLKGASAVSPVHKTDRWYGILILQTVFTIP